MCPGGVKVTPGEGAVAVAVLLSGKAEGPGTTRPSQDDGDEGDRVVPFLSGSFPPRLRRDLGELNES